MSDRPRLLLIDGSSYIYRAFYAIGHLSNSKGFPTNAIYGFTQMILKVLKDAATGIPCGRPRYKGAHLSQRDLQGI